MTAPLDAHEACQSMTVEAKYRRIIAAHEEICNEPNCSAYGHYAKAAKLLAELEAELSRLRGAKP